MVKEELVAGIKQAVERGDSLEQAKQSFINAGYNPQDVKEAASFLGAGTLASLPHFQELTPLPSPQPQLTQPPQPLQPQTRLPTSKPAIQQPKPQLLIKPQQLQIPAKPKKSRKKLVVILIIILLLLLAALGLFFFFKEKVTDLASRLFSYF